MIVHITLLLLTLMGLGTTHWIFTMGTRPTDFAPRAPDYFDVPNYSLDVIGLA